MDAGGSLSAYDLMALYTEIGSYVRMYKVTTQQEIKSILAAVDQCKNIESFAPQNSSCKQYYVYQREVLGKASHYWGVHISELPFKELFTKVMTMRNSNPVLLQ